MAKLLQLRGGTTSQHSSFTGAVREVTVDTDKDTLVVHDGSTQGGFALPRTNAEVSALVTPGGLNLVSTSSVPSLTAKGDGSSQDGYIQLNCSQNSHGIKLKSPPHSANASYTLTFPVNDGNANQILTTDGSGVMSWASVGSNSITAGDVNTAALGNGAVTTVKIADDAVTSAKIAHDVALVGNPTTTTQSASNNSTRIATTAYTDAAIAALADSAPSTLNTLNELAQALGDDASFSTTVTNSIATKLPLAGGTMTGNIAHAGAFTIDAGNNIVLDNGSSNLVLAHNGAQYALLTASSNNLVIKSGATTALTFTGANVAVAGTLTADLADNSINSEHYVDGSIDTAHIADGNVTTAKLAPDCITAAKIGNDIINSEHYAAGSIDTEHIADSSITLGKMASNSVNSGQYVDGSIDHVHLSANCIDADNIGDNVINSEHYVDGSIDEAHIATGAITAGKLGTSLGDLTGKGITYAGVANNFIHFNGGTSMKFTVNGNEEMRLESDGDLHVDGDVIAFSTTVSDERLKENITVVEGALDKVKTLRGVTFTRKQDGQESAGVIAQEVEKVLPQAVREKALPLQTGDDSLFKTVAYDALHALLIESIKELSAKIEKLEAK